MSSDQQQAMPFSTVVWDKDDALRRMGKKAERLKMMINIFLEESPDYIEGMEQAFSHRSCSELKSYSHTIKGASGNLGATRVFTMAEHIEQLAMKEQFDQAHVLWDEFKLSFDQLKQTLLYELQNDNTPLNSEENMQELLGKVYRTVKQGGFLTPGEINALANKAGSQDVVASIKMLADYMDEFETESSIATIKKIATMENVSLN